MFALLLYPFLRSMFRVEFEIGVGIEKRSNISPGFSISQ